MSLSLQVNGVEYLCDNAAPAPGAAAAAVVPAAGGEDAGGGREKLSQNSKDESRGECLWDYVLSDAGQDCFPLWFEVEEEGRKSVVMGAVFYFPIGEHSEEETVPRREVGMINSR